MGNLFTKLGQWFSSSDKKQADADIEAPAADHAKKAAASSPVDASNPASVAISVAAPAAEPAAPAAPAVPAAPAALPKIEPKSLMAFSLKDQVIFRPPGSIRGNEFVIDDCHNCDFYICDHTAQITADGCVNCRFFFGPCESSIFLRDCSNSQVVAACQQLRLRSCTDMQFSLFCGTEPVIESSARLQFGCFQFAYFSLREQFARANLSVWCNEWSRIHDFTAAGGALNWSFLDAAVASTDMLKQPLLAVGGGVFDAAELVPHARSIVPLTGGRRPLPAAFGSEPTACFALLLGVHAAAVDAAGADLLEATHAALAKGAACVSRTRLITLERAQLARLVDGAANAAALTATASSGDGTALALEFAGAAGDAEIGAALRAFAAQRSASVLCVEGGDALRLAALFFEEFKPKV